MFLQPILDRVCKLATAVAVDCCDSEYRPSPPIGVDKCRDALRSLVGFNQVEFVQHQPPRLVEERRVIALELLDDGARIGNRIAGAIKRGDIDHMQQQARALQMAQELMPESGAVGGARSEE